MRYTGASLKKLQFKLNLFTGIDNFNMILTGTLKKTKIKNQIPIFNLIVLFYMALSYIKIFF